MDATLSLLNLAGAVALLLWGVHMVQSGVQRAFGADLRRFLVHALDNRVKAAAAGLGVTAVLQSSTATGLMIASFAARGFVALVPALAVDARGECRHDVHRAGPVVRRLAAVSAAPAGGVAMFRTGGARIRDIGRVAIGLGLMLIALSQLARDRHALRGCSEPADSDGRRSRPTADLGAFGALLAWAAHSSVAVALLVMSFTEKGVVPFYAALALIVGANIGTALNPLLEGARAGEAARRGVGRQCRHAPRRRRDRPAAPHADRVGSLRSSRAFRARSRISTPPSTWFSGLAFLPLLGPLARLLERLMPDRVERRRSSDRFYLDDAAAETPSIALGHAAREVAADGRRPRRDDRERGGRVAPAVTASRSLARAEPTMCSTRSTARSSAT